MSTNIRHYKLDEIDPELRKLAEAGKLTGPCFIGQGLSKQIGSDCYGRYITSEIKTEFRRRVLECHYQLVEFSKKETGAKWWSVQRLDITGWKEVDEQWTKEEAEAALVRYVNQFIPPKQKILKEV